MTPDAPLGGPPRDPDATESTPVPTPRRRSRYVPAVLDAIIPGVGHLFAGRRRRALLFLSPTLVAIAIAVWVGLTTSGPRLAATLISTEVIWGLLAAQGLFLVWRLLAVGSSLLDPRCRGRAAATRCRSRSCSLVMIVPQVYAGYATEVAPRGRRRDLRRAAARRGR